MKRTFTLFLILLFLSIQILPNTIYRNSKVKKVNLAILLDTSSSMDGLINQARSELWRIVNEIAALSKQMPDTKLELSISIFEYGNDKLSKTDNFIRLVNQLTQDLDQVSDNLFALKTYGGYEYCGAVMLEALQKLEWAKEKDALKLIVIAGNEPFNQGPVDFREVCKKAVEQGIKINTIYCGNPDNSEADEWRTAANLGKGTFMSINQNDKQEEIPTPYDDKILELNSALNDTYIYFTSAGKEAKYRQEKSDEDIQSTSKAGSIDRAATKSTEFYDNSGWDLIDASKNGDFNVQKIDKTLLPEKFQKFTDSELLELIAKYSAEREKIKEEIKNYQALRNKYLIDNIKTEVKNTFGGALIESIKHELKIK